MAAEKGVTCALSIMLAALVMHEAAIFPWRPLEVWVLTQGHLGQRAPGIGGQRRPQSPDFDGVAEGSAGAVDADQAHVAGEPASRLQRDPDQRGLSGAVGRCQATRAARLVVRRACKQQCQHISFLVQLT